MTDDDSLDTIIESIHNNLYAAAEELEVADEFDPDPEKTKGVLDPRRPTEKGEMSTDERLGFLLDQSTEIARTVAAAVGVPERKLKGELETAFEKTDFTLTPAESNARARRVEANRKQAAASSDDTEGFTLDPRGD
jgi:hypothetical protein